MAGGLSNLISKYITYLPLPSFIIQIIMDEDEGKDEGKGKDLALTLTPLTNNILAALLTVLYVKCILDIGSILRERLGCAYESRKLVHVGAACWICFWPLFDVMHWSWRLNILVPTVMAIKLFYKVRSMENMEYGIEGLSSWNNQ